MRRFGLLDHYEWGEVLPTVLEKEGYPSEARGDGPMIALTISGAPRTKKNSRVHTRSGVPLPSKAWRKWVHEAVLTVDGAIAFYVDGATKPWIETVGGVRDWTPLCDPMNVRAIFYRDADRGDAVGYYQGLADLLEARGIVTNDRHFVSWDGSRLEVDRANPRVTVVLEPLEAS